MADKAAIDLLFRAVADMMSGEAVAVSVVVLRPVAKGFNIERMNSIHRDAQDTTARSTLASALRAQADDIVQDVLRLDGS